MYDTLVKQRNYILEHLNEFKPSVGLILGSGLGDLAQRVGDPVIVNYGDIPEFPVSTVTGHAGRFLFGSLSGCNVAVMQGRFHHYEGYSLQQVCMPVRIMAMLGCSKLVVTNAAGGINLNFKAGDLMLIEDHINLMGDNPLIGPNIEELGPRFPDMSCAYDAELKKIALECAKKHGIGLRQGVYVALNGPSYETPAEIRMLRLLGADAVGMSTVPEVIAAVHAGMKVLGISCITNMAAGVLPQPLSHKEVMDTANAIADMFQTLIMGIIKEMA
ncbi:MAG: purine-nucleoside phosphorylase [Clostridiales bacterium]|nr:purine-nucleoside phosphorylase [Clostridiales bacterium]